MTASHSLSRDVDDPLISVVMNGFNSARYLAEALESVRSQSYARWELVFWDNCSEDDSERIVHGFRETRFRFLRAPRRMTLAAGRNAAVGQARGDWIAFLDCDDIWLPFKLERQIARLRSAPPGEREVGMVYGRTVSFSDRGDEGETTYQYEGRPLPEGDILRALLLEGNLVPIVSALVSRRAFDATGGIPERYTFAEDYWLFLAIAARYRVLCVQEPCCRYRIHEASATARNKLVSHEEALSVLREWGQHLHQRERLQREAIYHTLIGIELMRTRGRRIDGIARLLREGSLSFALHGSMRHLYRRHVRRKRPYA